MHGQYFKDGLYYKEADAKSQRSYIELGTCCRFLLLTASQLTVCIYAIRKKKILQPQILLHMLPLSANVDAVPMLLWYHCHPWPGCGCNRHGCNVQIAAGRL